MVTNTGHMQPGPISYDPKPDLDAFFGAVADGVLGQVDPDDFFGLVRRVSAHPGHAFHSLRMDSVASAATSDDVATPMIDMYVDQVARTPLPDLDDRFSVFLDNVAARVRVSGDDVASACGGDSVAFDRMMDTYYRS